MEAAPRTETTLPVLTVRPPWSHLFFRAHPTLGVKTVENRTWPPPKTWYTPGTPMTLVIHAGKAVDHNALRFLRITSTLFLMPRACLLGLVDVVDVRPSNSCKDFTWHQSGYTGWYVSNARALDPVIARKGAQGLWAIDRTELGARTACPGCGALLLSRDGNPPIEHAAGGGWDFPCGWVMDPQ